MLMLESLRVACVQGQNSQRERAAVVATSTPCATGLFVQEWGKRTPRLRDETNHGRPGQVGSFPLGAAAVAAKGRRALADGRMHAWHVQYIHSVPCAVQIPCSVYRQDDRGSVARCLPQS